EDVGAAKIRFSQAIESLELPLTIRGEVLTVEQFQQLAATLGAKKD
ncbi:MAG: 16S rRNA (adenine(1518)-N(6)/adenine(1519)-N(6))-dimethyltransferase, partial [Desulfofustis sp.]|nr:16S rRNA (adenine(1518)-N(6)/adenine(1519)-N(6))-dimethyltransferase [Desulfofustis sp.]